MIGRVGVYCGSIHLTSKQSWVTDNAIFIKKILDEINVEYLFQYLSRLNISLLGEVSAQPKISQGILNNLTIHYPENKKEQQKIVSILTTIDELISLYDLIIKSTKKLKKGLMETLLTKGIEHKKFKKLLVVPKFINFSIPDSWKVVKLHEISSEIKDGPMGFGLHTYDYVEKGIPILRIKNLKNLTVTKNDLRFISEEKHEELKKSQVKPLDIIISKTGVLGMLGVIPVDYGPANLNQALARITLKNKKIILFIITFLSSKIPQQILHVIGSSRTVQAGLKLSDIKNLKIPIPQSNEQDKIISILSNSNSKISELESKKFNLENLKKGLMQQLLTGQIRVKI